MRRRHFIIILLCFFAMLCLFYEIHTEREEAINNQGEYIKSEELIEVSSYETKYVSNEGVENSSKKTNSNTCYREDNLSVSIEESIYNMSSYKDSEKPLLDSSNRESQIPEELLGLIRKNEELFEYVYSYPEKKDVEYEIDLSDEAKNKSVPLLIQWDERWGYKEYGTGLIGYTGCGPVCLSMVAIYLTSNPEYTPF